MPGHDAVFMDVAGIAPGRDFRRVIDEHVATCGVLLAIIGKAWVNAKDASGRHRLDDPADFVRLETASALKRDIPVVPVLVHGAGMPQSEQLPPDLAELAFRNGVELTHARWDSDVQLLIKALEPYVQASRIEPDRVAVAAPPAAARGAPAAAPSPAKRSSLLVAGAAAVAVLLAFGAYQWFAAQGRASERARQELIASQAASQAEAARVAAQAAASAAETAKLVAAREAVDKAAAEAEAAKQAAAQAARKRAQEDEAANRLAQERRDREIREEAARKLEQDKREREARDEAARKLAQTKLDSAARELADSKAAHRARWQTWHFPPPNGGAGVFTITPDGNPACASYDGGGCLWGVSYEQIDFARLKPLVCGEAHRARWGVTGYEDPKHWCNLAKRARPHTAPK